MLKLIYLAKRRPGFTFDEFVCRWRQHGALAMAQPLWRFSLGYVQAEPIKPAPVTGVADEYDAVACYMVQDDMFSSMNEQDVAGAMRMAEDELETFSAPIPSVSLWVREEHIKAGELGGITTFLFCKHASAARRIAQQAGSAVELDRVTLNLRDDAAPGPDMNTLAYEAVVELSASSIARLKAALGTGASALTSACDVAVITREAVLWNRLQP